MGAFFDFLFSRKRPAPTDRYRPLYPESQITIEKSRQTKTIRLVEREFDPNDGSDLIWQGFVIRDDRDIAIGYAEIGERVHPSVRIFKIAGVSYRSEALQSEAFAPGKMLTLQLEDDNLYDQNAIGIWDELGTVMVGYVPRDENETIRGILRLSPNSRAMVLAQMRKDGRRIALQVLFGPIVSNELVED